MCGVNDDFKLNDIILDFFLIFYGSIKLQPFIFHGFPLFADITTKISSIQ